MFKISRKQHIILIIVSIVTLYSCDYFVSKKDNEKNKKNVVNENILINQEQAKLLVNTSKKVLEIIDLCRNFEKTEIEEEKKVKIAKIREQQEHILKEIKNISNQVMVSVPSTVDKKQNVSELSDVNLKLYQLNSNVISQKELIINLKKNSLDDTIVSFSENILPVIDQNINLSQELLN